MPPPPAGKGWQCFAGRDRGGKTHSMCVRSVEDCRDASDAVAKKTGDAGMCTAVPRAACWYAWKNQSDNVVTRSGRKPTSDDNFNCYDSLAECRLSIPKKAYGELKVSECAELD
jgi:hypothetical protein